MSSASVVDSIGHLAIRTRDLDAAVAHAVAKHGHDDSGELREQLRGLLVDAEPALA